MALEPKFGTTSVLVTLAIGAVCGIGLYYFLGPDPCKDVVPQPAPVTMAGFFDRESISTMTDAPGAWGARFYIAMNAAGSFTVLAGPINDDGAHIPDKSGTLQFMLYKSIANGRSEMTILNESQAVVAVRNASTAARPGWSLDVTADVLVSHLRIGSANAVGLLERSTTNRDRSFDMAPIKLSGNAAYLEGTASDILVGAYPCPMHCPKDARFYLHTR